MSRKFVRSEKRCSLRTEGYDEANSVSNHFAIASKNVSAS